MKLFKKLLCGILSATMLITSASISVMAANDITVKLDGQTLSFDVPPQVINDRTMVPLRAIFEALGASVDWNQETKTVTSTKGGTTIKMTIDSHTMYVNNNPVTLDTPACVVNNRTLVPVRAISEAYNTNVNWDGNTRTVTITTSGASSSKFSILANAMMANYNYDSNNNRYYMVIPGDNISIAVSYNLNGKTVAFTSSYKVDNYISTYTLFMSETDEPALLIEKTLGNTENSMWVTFPSPTHKMSVVQSDMSSSDVQALLNTVNTTLELFDAIIQDFGVGLTLSDFGVSYGDTNSSNTNNTTSVPSSPNTNNTTSVAPSSSGLTRLAQNIVSNGAYQADTNTYSIWEKLADSTDIYLSVDMADNHIFIVTTYENSNYTSQVGLLLYANEDPYARVSLEMSGASYYLGGTFSANGKFYRIDGNMPASAEQDALNLLSSDLGLIDAYLQNNGFGTLREFGITY